MGKLLILNGVYQNFVCVFILLLHHLHKKVVLMLSELLLMYH